MAEKTETAAGATAAAESDRHLVRGHMEGTGNHSYSDAPTRASLPVTIGEWSKNGREVVRVRLDRFHGRDTVDARVWWTDDADELRPGKAGLTLAVRHLPQLADALAEAVTVARDLGMLPPETGEPPETDGGAA